MGEENELERLIKQRMKQAENKDIRNKAGVVAYYLGKGHESKNGDEEMRDFTYEKNRLKIHDTFSQGRDRGGDLTAGWSTEVFYQGKLVFNDHDCYIPGKWETLLETLYKEALPLQKKRDAAEQAERDKQKLTEENELRARWGLPRRKA